MHHQRLFGITSSYSVADRPYACPVCGARYINKRHLGDHLKQHQGQTRCLLCQKEFAFRYNMRRHMLTSHKLTQEQVDALTKSKPATTSWSAQDPATAVTGRPDQS